MKTFIKKYLKEILLILILSLGLGGTFLFSSFILNQNPEIKTTIGAIPCIEDTTKRLNDRIKDCPIPKNERANFKGNEIAKLDFPEYTDLGITIEIKDRKVNYVNGALELYARAWKGAKQLGFGKGGTTEWEHFIIPIKMGGNYDDKTQLVITDPLGDISVDYQKTDPETGIVSTKTIKYRYDPLAVLQRQLADTIRVSSKDGSKIIKGSIGNTTSTFYPDAGTGNTTVDGWVMRDDGAAGVAWATVHDGAGTLSADTEAEGAITNLIHGTDSNKFRRIQRSIYTFNTAAIPDTDVISSATMSLFGSGKSDTASGAPTIDIYTSTPANNNALVNGDYSQIQTTSQTGAPITYANWSTSAYNDFAFNATGIGNISKTGISPFAALNANYDAANTAPTWSNGNVSGFSGYAADQVDTTNDPKLVVVHAAAATAAPTSQNIILFE